MNYLTVKRVFIWGLYGAAALAVLIFGAWFSIYLLTTDYIYNDVSAAPEVDTVLIPGAAVSAKGVLSPIFIDRVDIAVALYKAGKVQKILVSGDNSTLSYNEVNPVRVYLLSEGIPESDIFLDHAGFDTYSSMYRARDVFGVTSVIIATQSFHLPRAVFIARILGLEAVGINADEGRILRKNYHRELLANVKALIDLVLVRQPKFLGEPIPITGEAQSLSD